MTETTIVPPPIPTIELSETGARVPRRFEPERLKWAVLAVPWLWFAIRDVHAWMEFAAIALPVACMAAVAVLGVVAVVRRSGRTALLALSVTVFAVVAVTGPWRPQSDPDPETSFRVATMNVGLYWFSDNDAGFFVERNSPDLLVGIELTESHDREFVERFENSISEVIPLQRMQENARGVDADGDTYRSFGLPSIGVYSNLPITRLTDPIAATVDGGLPGFRVRVDAPDGPIVLYALHIPKSAPGSGTYEQSASEQLAMVEAIRDAIEIEELPVVVLGDLNLTDRGPGYRTLTSALKDGMRAGGWALPTADRPLPWSLLFLRIDHLLVSERLCTGDALAEDTRFSDHRPLVADIGLCPN